MELDFTALNNIPLQRAGKGFTEPLEYTEGNLAIQTKKPATEQQGSLNGEAVTGALHRLQIEKRERNNARKVYAVYQQNMKRAGTLRSDITKDLMAGKDPLAILLKAVECIGLMTGDTISYIQNKESILAIYGWGLQEVIPLKVEMEEAQHRLAMLTRPELEDCPLDAQKRITQAIQAHRALIDKLKREIERTHK